LQRSRLKTEREVTDALELLERFADTGKTKKALRDFRKAFWGEWRGLGSFVYTALHEALNPASPESAVTSLAHALQQEHGLSDKEAAREIRRLYRDLISPLVSSHEFTDAWRTPAVVGLAQSMYESRDFRDMPRLAEALQQAGCTAQAVIDHCRDPNALHIRGCWVVDAILDGNWATVPAVPEPKQSPLLSVLPKTKQYWIREQMEERDGHLTLEQYLAQRWDFEGYRRSQGMSDEQIADWFAKFSRRYPDWTREQVRIASSVAFACESWGYLAIARRFALDDPAELRRGHCLSLRQGWLEMRLADAACPGLGGDVKGWAIVHALAVRDHELAKRWAERAAHPIQEDDDVASKAVLACYQGDFDAMRALVDRMAKHKVPPYQKWAFTCLNGIAQRDSALVAEGLRQRLEYESHQRVADRSLVVTEVHGFYWLCRAISPDLIAGFDVNQPFPWDAKFHASVQEHALPLEDVDLTDISPILHKALVQLELPDWWIAAADSGSPTDLCAIVLTSVGPNPRIVFQHIKNLTGASDTDATNILKSCPTVLRSGVSRLIAWASKESLEMAGASVEMKTG
jgi:ribosomal protein L7/L12